MKWLVVTGEYPPQPGGVSDYSRVVSRALVAAGDRVEVWAPPCPGAPPDDDGIVVNRLPDRFGPRALSMLRRRLRDNTGDERVLIQYVPHAFGWKAMNLPLCLVLRTARERTTVMFHEVAFPFQGGLRHRVLAMTNRVMAKIVASSAARVCVSTPAWSEILRRLAPCAAPIEWLPVPSSIPASSRPDDVAAARANALPSGARVLIGRFGAFTAESDASCARILESVVASRSDAAVLLIGHGARSAAERFTKRAPVLVGKIRTVEALSPEGVAANLKACDVLLQFYPDGVTTRRTSVMSALALGCAVVSNLGELSEAFWSNCGALAVARDEATVFEALERVLSDAGERARLGAEASNLYRSRFSVEHTVATLRAGAA